MSKLLVSVLMNCYNGEKYLREAIDSVYSQTYKNWEIIFWDNASTDNSMSIVKMYDNKIKYFKKSETVPLYQARNLAIDRCNGEVVTFLDCDDIWVKDKLEKQVALYNDGNQFIYGRYELIDSGGEKIQKKLHKLKFGKVTNSLLINNFISIGSVLIDIRLIRELKFNPNYNLIGDFDLWVRASMKTQFNFVDVIVEKSRQHNENLSIHLQDDWIKEERMLYKNILHTYGVLRLPMIIVFILRAEIKSVITQLFKHI